MKERFEIGDLVEWVAYGWNTSLRGRVVGLVVDYDDRWDMFGVQWFLLYKDGETSAYLPDTLEDEPAYDSAELMKRFVL